MNKNVIILVLSVLLLLSAVGSGTLAYYSAQETAHNVISSGNVDITLVEKMDDGDPNTELVDFPKTGISGITPGSTVSKIVSVSNTGDAEAWIRLSVDTSIKKGTGVFATALPTIITVGSKSFPVFTYEVDQNKWLYKDGFYYYHKPVAPGASTEIFFDKVVFSAEAGNEYQQCTVFINITADAVQSANNPIPDGGTVTDIPGWPD